MQFTASNKATSRPKNYADTARFVGYVLVSRYIEPGPEVCSKLEQICHGKGYTLECTEWDVKTTYNPIRMGLWRALRRLICDKCAPQRMSFCIMGLEDYLDQAFAPCHCDNPKGLDGIVMNSLGQLCTDPVKGTKIILTLAKLRKHLITQDGICLSCCHPATKGFF